MKRKHERRHMEKHAYLIRHVCGTAIVTALFACTPLFKPLCRGERADCFALWMLAAACCTFGLMVTWRSRRRRELWFDVFAPSLLWLVAAQIKSVPVPVICASCGVAIVHLVLPRLLGADSGRKASPLRMRWLLFLRRLRRGGAGAIAAILVFLGVRGFFFAPTVQPPRAEEREQITIESGIEELTKLEPGRWAGLDMKQRLAVAKTVADVEADAYGLPERLNVEMKALSSGTRAEYTHSRRCVTLDKELLRDEPPDEVLRSVLHECRHAYQHQLVSLYESADDTQKDLLIFRESDIPELKDSFDSYVDGDRDYENYFRQRCEVDARDWADSRSIVYISAIRNHLEDADAAQHRVSHE